MILLGATRLISTISRPQVRLVLTIDERLASASVKERGEGNTCSHRHQRCPPDHSRTGLGGWAAVKGRMVAFASALTALLLSLCCSRSRTSASLSLPPDRDKSPPHALSTAKLTRVSLHIPRPPGPCIAFPSYNRSAYQRPISYRGGRNPCMRGKVA